LPPRRAAAAAAPAGRREGAIPTGDKKVELENGLRWKVREEERGDKGRRGRGDVEECSRGK
jgi:hypothetical protein